MRRFLFLVLVLLLLPLFALSSQEEIPLPSRAFPLALLLEAAESDGSRIWQPDWPLELPPDSFALTSGDWTSISLNLEDDVFFLRREKERLLEFPWFFDGTIVQVRLGFSTNYGNGELRLQNINLGDLASLEVLEHSEGYPSLVRSFRDGSYSFALFERGPGFISESWFDAEGSFLELFEYSFFPGDRRERIRGLKSFTGEADSRRSFDSRFLITAINSSEGDYSVHYIREDLPGYRKWQPLGMDARNYAFQWDEKGFLIRLSSADGLEARYEYVLDNRGNWIERKETLMVPYSGILIPSPGRIVTRVLEYSETHE